MESVFCPAARLDRHSGTAMAARPLSTGPNEFIFIGTMLGVIESAAALFRAKFRCSNL
jgi:hypothetical protein